MASDVREKLITSFVDHALKSPGLVLAAVAAYGMAFSSWFGSMVITGFLLGHEVDPPNLNIVKENEPFLLVAWSRNVLHKFLDMFVSSGISLLFILILLAGIFLLILHIFSKEKIRDQETNDIPVYVRALFRIYQRGYYSIALGMLTILTLLVFVSARPGLVFVSAAFLTLFIVASTYVHAADVTRGTVWDRSVYIFGLAVLAMMLVLFPNHYGKHFFDMAIEIPAEADGRKALTPDSVIFRFIGFNKIGGKFYYKEERKFMEFIRVNTWKSLEELPTESPFRGKYLRLKKLLREFPPKPVDVSDDQIDRALEELKR